MSIADLIDAIESILNSSNGEFVGALGFVATDIVQPVFLASVATVGTAVVGATVATQVFPFVRSWIKRLRGAGSR